MNVQPLAVTPEAALVALREYKQHRNVYDRRDWEIERIYRQIAKGKTVISVRDAIRRAGVDEKGRPHLAIARADATNVFCRESNSVFTFCPDRWANRRKWHEDIAIPGATMREWGAAAAQLPRIPPQYRPVAGTLESYHLLWEADWREIPRDPYLLRRIGKDAWVVLAAWDLTEVELSVLRAHQ